MCPELVELCDAALVRDKGFLTERSFARMPPEEFTEDFLRGAGIRAEGLVYELLELHRELREEYHPAEEEKKAGLVVEGVGCGMGDAARDMVTRLLHGGSGPSNDVPQPMMQQTVVATNHSAPAVAHWQPLYAKKLQFC
jgi:hypothetical protein